MDMTLARRSWDESVTSSWTRASRQRIANRFPPGHCSAFGSMSRQRIASFGGGCGYRLRCCGGRRLRLLLWLHPRYSTGGYAADRTISRQNMRCAPSNVLLAAALVAVAVLLVAPSMVAGAGPHHLMPLIPTLSFILGLILARSPGWESGPGWRPRAILVSGIAYALAATGSAAFVMREDVKTLSFLNDEARQVLADIEEVCSKFPDSTIAMGCGDNGTFRYTFYRAVPVFKGHPYLADPIALMAMKKVGFDLPPRTLDALASGETAIWLIPAGDDPFSMQSQFKGQAEVYDPAFRRIFLEKYDKVGRTKLFDVWSYSPSKPPHVAGGPGRRARSG